MNEFIEYNAAKELMGENFIGIDELSGLKTLTKKANLSSGTLTTPVFGFIVAKG